MAVGLPRDPGLQPERTLLAWKRTALAMLGNALLVLRAGMQGHHPALTISAGLLIATAIGLAFIASRRGMQLLWQEHSCPATPFLLISAITALAACVGFVSLIVVEAHR